MKKSFYSENISVPTSAQLRHYIEKGTYFRIKPGANTRVGLTDVNFRNNVWDFLKWRDSLSQLELNTEPWPHLVIKQFLPNKLYTRLIESLPRTPKPSSSPSRTWVTTTPQLFTSDITEKFFFHSEEERNWWGTKILTTLAELTCVFMDRQTMMNLWRNFDTKNRWSESNSDDSILLVQIRLTHDRDDYNLDVHTDTPEKLLSILVYLPLDETITVGGTSVYTPKDEYVSKLTMTENMGQKYFPTSLFNFKKKIPFASNTGFVFLRTDESWHGKPLDPSDFRADRFTLQINYFSYKTAEIEKIGGINYFSAN